MTDEGPFWIVMVRDMSDVVDDSPTAVVCLVLDQATGLIRGLSIGATAAVAGADAFRAALTKSTGVLPPAPPVAVSCDLGYAHELTPVLKQLLKGTPMPPIEEAVPPDEAEDILDSVLGYLAGREQPPPDEWASPDDWLLLVEYTLAFCRAEPWGNLADDDVLRLVTTVDDVASGYVATVLGSAGIQRGLNLFAGDRVPRGFGTWQPGEPLPLPPESIIVHLNPPEDAIPEHVGKALRYGWPPEADIMPTWLMAVDNGFGDLDRAGVRDLTLAFAAIITYADPDRPRPARPSTPAARGKTRAPAAVEGKLTFPDGLVGTFTIR